MVARECWPSFDRSCLLAHREMLRALPLTPACRPLRAVPRTLSPLCSALPMYRHQLLSYSFISVIISAVSDHPSEDAGASHPTALARFLTRSIMSVCMNKQLAAGRVNDIEASISGQNQVDIEVDIRAGEGPPIVS